MTSFKTEIINERLIQKVRGFIEQDNRQALEKLVDEMRAADLADITAKSLTPLIVADDKVYDGATTATLSSQTVTGVIGGETVTLLVTAADFDTKDVGTDKTFAVTCNLAQAGSSRFEAAAAAAGDLTASGDVDVKVEAIADLALDVTDPSGPVPIGTEATYQVRVQNRGTKGAQEVEVVAYFSDGIEPTAVKGGRHETAPGQVLFDKIPSLAPGQDVTFQIKAKAGTPGNHVCRVEVYCKPLGTRLVSEETTYFYGNAGTAHDGPSPRAAQDDSAGTEEAIRTAEQRPAPASPKNQ